MKYTYCPYWIYGQINKLIKKTWCVSTVTPTHRWFSIGICFLLHKRTDWRMVIHAGLRGLLHSSFWSQTGGLNGETTSPWSVTLWEDTWRASLNITANLWKTLANSLHYMAESWQAITLLLIASHSPFRNSELMPVTPSQSFVEPNSMVWLSYSYHKI